jgi:hypothetical protein
MLGGPLSVLQNFRSFVDDPVADTAAGNSSIGGRADRPSSIVAPEPESANNNSAKTKMATSPAAAAPARAGRSAWRSHRRCGSIRARARGQRRWVSRADKTIAGRSPLRLATFSLPTHREVVAAASRISASGVPYPQDPPAPVRSMLRVCIPRRRDYANQ